MTIIKSQPFGIQRKIVANMTADSNKNIPHVTYMYEADVTDFFAYFKEFNAKNPADKKVTFNTVILKVIAEALKKVPNLNAHLEFNRKLVRGRLHIIKEINITMPMIFPNGEMMTVNLLDFGNKNIYEMTEYIDNLKKKIENTNLEQAMYEVSLRDTLIELRKGHPILALYRAIGSLTGKDKINVLKGKEKRKHDSIPKHKRVTVDDLKQGTVMVTNFGSLYPGQKGAGAMLEIIPPQITAYAIGAVTKKPVVITENNEDKIVIRSILPICIAFDHRALDFDDIIPMIKAFDDIFSNFGSIFPES